MLPTGPGFFYFPTRRTASPLAGIEPAYLRLARPVAIHYTMPLDTRIEFLVDLIVLLHYTIKKIDLTKIAKVAMVIVIATLAILVKKYFFYFSIGICKLDRQKPNPQIFLLYDNFFYFFLIFTCFSTHKIFLKCRSKKSEPDISPILDFSSGICKSDPQKPNLKVFLQSRHFFYIFQIFKVFFK